VSTSELCQKPPLIGLPDEKVPQNRLRIPTTIDQQGVKSPRDAFRNKDLFEPEIMP